MNKILRQQLIDVVGEKNLIFEPADDDERLIDHRRYFRGITPAIVFPQSTDQVSQLVEVCIDNNLAVVPQGGNTGYGGGATPDQSGKQLLFCLSKMNRICEIDSINYTMTVEAGVILADVQQAAESANMYFPLSLGAQGSCQIGGNISTNAGGHSVLKYGNTRDLILGLEVVLADASILSDLNKLRKNNTGYNLSQLFAGAEGSLGIITKAVLKTFPLPRFRCCLLLAFSDIEKLYDFYRLSREQSADCISSFEYISRHSVELVEQGPVESPFPLRGKFDHYTLVEFSSSSEYFPLDQIVQSILNNAMENDLVADGIMTQSEKQRQSLWRFREAIPETERILGGSIKHDISLPISRIAEFLEHIPSRLNRITQNKRLSIYGHIGDGNLHFNLLPTEQVGAAEFKDKFEQQLSDCVYQLTHALEGSFSAEHGIGQLKKGRLKKFKPPEALDLMCKIKQALDRNNIMNPGKLVDIGG